MDTKPRTRFWGTRRERMWRRFRGSTNELIYAATYTIDSRAVRVGAPIKGSVVDEVSCVVFYGDSYTFGEGLNDSEALPYLVSEKSNGRYRTFNLAFHGYGPHQMLASLEANREQQILDCTPDHAIYQAIPEHAVRVTGRQSCDKHGPRYVFNAEGHAERQGQFHHTVAAKASPNSRFVVRGFWKVATQSLIYQKIAENSIYRIRPVEFPPG
jgi:hypothetical protein